MPISPDRILFDDPHFLAVNKLSGELVVKGSGPVGKLPLLDFLKKDYPGLRPVNRLDFETSGVVLFARTKQALDAALETEFEKVYRTIVAGRIERPSGTISAKLPARTRKGMVDAETKYRVLQRFMNSSYLEATIESGKFHQIRKHFAGIKHPLALDHVYGDKRFNRVFTQEFGYRKFFLHALSLSFIHPFTKEKIAIEAPIPKPFEDVLKKLQSVS